MNLRLPERPDIRDVTADHEDDRTAIVQIIADIETGLNTNDADLMTASFARNSVVVSATGQRLTGWERILDAHRAGLQGFLRDEHVRYEIDTLEFLRPEIAIAYKVAHATMPSGELLDLEPTMIALYVLVKQDGRWWIAARQNTPIPSAG